MISPIRIFKLLMFLCFVADGWATPQHPIDISLRVPADPTRKIYSQTDSIVLESTQNSVLITIQSSTKNKGPFFCELDDGVSGSDTFTIAGQLLLKNLTGGIYHLSVRQLDQKDTAHIWFTIKPLRWQQPWFLPLVYTLVLCVVLAIGYLFALYNFRQKLRLQQIRNEIAADLHDDVGTALSSISFLGEMAKARFEKKPEDVRPILERIMNESREMMQTMRGVVWVINPQNDKATDFFEKVRSFADAVLQSKKIELTFLVETANNQQLGLEVQRNLFLIFKETVVNAAKHAEATEVAIVINAGKEYVRIRIGDNGKGFDTGAVSDGNGLRNL